MFFFGKKKNKKKLADITHYCFSSEEGKWSYLLDQLKESEQKGALWILAHFEQTIAKFQTGLKKNGISYEMATHRFGGLVLCQARDIPSNISGASEVWCLEEHPLYSETETLLEKLREYGIKDLRVHVGIDEPIFDEFNDGSRLEIMMSKFGMREGEVLSHKMISKSIANIQKKIEKRHNVIVHTTTSQEDWFRANQ